MGTNQTTGGVVPESLTKKEVAGRLEFSTSQGLTISSPNKTDHDAKQRTDWGNAWQDVKKESNSPPRRNSGSGGENTKEASSHRSASPQSPPGDGGNSSYMVLPPGIKASPKKKIWST